jgi:hypothetical protein
MSKQEDFVAGVYAAAKNIGLSDPAARVAAAQAALETGYGRAVKGNNFFGIKAGKSWNGKKQSFNTWEEVNGKRVNIKDQFRAYATPEESLKDWANLMERRFPDVLTAPTFDEAVAALNAGKKGGYATDTKYASKLGFIDRTFAPSVSAINAVSVANVPAPTFKDDQFNNAPVPGLFGAPAQNFDIAGNPTGTTYGISPYGGAVPTPQAKPAPAMPARSLVDPRAFSAPVERGILADVAPAPSMDQATAQARDRMAAPVDATQDYSMPGIGSFPGRPAPEVSGMLGARTAARAASVQDYSMPAPSSAQMAELTAGLNAQKASMQAPAGIMSAAAAETPGAQIGALAGQPAFSQDKFNSMVAAPSMPTAQPSFGPMPSMDSIKAKAMEEDRVLSALAKAAPIGQIAAPAAMPSMDQATVGARNRMAAPARTATGADVWSGRAQTGVATNGNQLSRNPDGSVSMTSSKYGYTETMNPDGSFRSTTAPGLFGLDAAANGLFGGIGKNAAPAATEDNSFEKSQGRFSGKAALEGALKGAAMGMLAGNPLGGAAIGAARGGFGLGRDQGQQGGGLFGGIGNALGGLFGGGSKSNSGGKSGGNKSEKSDKSGKSGKGGGGNAASFGGGESR